MKSSKDRRKILTEILKSKRLLILPFIIVVLLFVLSRGASDPSLIRTAKVVKKDLSSQVIASGKVSADKRATVHFAVGGKVISVVVRKGDYLKKGQVIASLDREIYEIAQRQVQQDVIVADAELEKVYDDLGDKNDVETFDEKIKRTAAEAKKNKAFDNLKRAQRDLKDTNLTSPISGTVVSLSINPGQEVLPSEEVAKIADTKTIEFTAEVDETDIPKIDIGQSAIVKLDAFPDKEINSLVKSIASESIITSTGATAFEVKLTFPDPGDLLLGMNGQVQIISQTVKNASVIPQEAVVDENFVFLKINGNFQKKEVKMGIFSETEVQIVDGLGEGDETVISGFDEIGKKSLLQKLIIIFKK